MPLRTTQYGYIIDPLVPLTDDTGRTISNGYIRVFMAGTSTPVITYKNFDGSTNEETVQLDNSGRTAYPVIGSKGSTYKVCVYDAEHSQEDPILTIDKVVPTGASVEATNVITGLDTVVGTGQATATVAGTTVTIDVPRIKDLTNTATESDIASGNYFALDGSAGTKKLNSTTLLTKTAQNALGSIHSLSGTATDFASDDYMVIDGSTNGSRKMGKFHNLLQTSKSISFELGDIPSMSASGWNYSDSTTRVRTAIGSIIPMKAGDKISLLMPYRTSVYVLAHNLDGTTTYSGWQTKEYTIVKDCNVALVLALSTNANLVSLPSGVSLYDFLVSSLYIISDGKYFGFSQNALGFFKLSKNGVAKRIVLTQEFFELGNITITDSGWSYSSSTTRIRLKQGLTLVLDKGDSISFGTEINKYLGIRKLSDGTYSHLGWIGTGNITEYVAQFPCEVVFLIDTSDFSSIADFAVTPYTYASLVKKYADIILGKIPENMGAIPTSILENGTMNADGSEPEYSDYLVTQRVRTKVGFSFYFKQGEKIDFAGISKQKILGVTETNGTFHRVILNSSDMVYQLPYDAFVVFMVVFGETTTPQDLVNVKVSFNVLSRSLPAWIDFCDEKIYKNKPSVIDARFNLVGPVGVAHRGFSSTCPENTLPAFQEAVRQGFKCIEIDVRLTSDGVFVLLHDSTIDRTSDGSGAIASLTYSQVENLDFGSWKDASFAGTKIGRLDEFLDFCNMTGVFPFIEILFAQNSTNTSALFALLNKKGMFGRCMIFGGDMSSSASYYNYITTLSRPMRFVQPIGVFLSAFTVTDGVASSTLANDVKTLVGKGFIVVAAIDYSVLTDDMVDFLVGAGVYIDVYTVDDLDDLTGLNKCVRFVTSDNLEASTEMKNYAIGS